MYVWSDKGVPMELTKTLVLLMHGFSNVTLKGTSVTLRAFTLPYFDLTVPIIFTPNAGPYVMGVRSAM